MSETPQYHPEVLDQKWYERFLEINFSDFDKLDGDGKERQQQKEAFLAGEVEEPTLDYPQLETFDLDEREQKLLALKEKILSQEHNETIAKLYRTRINEALAQLRMLRASREGDDRRFARYSEFVYGKPEGDLVCYTNEFVRRRVERGSESKYEIKREAAARLASHLAAPEMLEKAAKEAIEPPQVAGEGHEGTISDVDEVVALFEMYLEKEGIDDWDVVVTDNQSVTGFRVSQEEKKVVIPGTQFTGEKGKAAAFIHGFLAHEGKHVQRRHHGERSKLALLGVGLDRVEKGEEGVATYTEQQVRGTKEFAHPQRYFAIAYAKGDIDGEPKTFRQTYEMLKDYYLVSLKPDEELESRAENSAWTLAVRVFRGSTCKTPGAVYTKDMAYFAGNKETWQLVSKNSDVVQTFSVGKFDAANERHVSMLVELGILDEDLTMLAEEDDS